MTRAEKARGRAVARARAALEARATADARYRAALSDALVLGVSYAELARELGTSRQALRQLMLRGEA